MTMENDLVERKAWPLGGYAPGHYSCTCITCGKLHEADKRASQCLVCAAQGANARIQALEAELVAALIDLAAYEKRCEGLTNHANNEARRADDNAARADRAEAELARKTEALREISSLNSQSRPDIIQDVINAARSALEEKTDV